MKKLILPFLLILLLHLSACDDPTVAPQINAVDNAKSSIIEDIVFIDTERDSTGADLSYLYAINTDGSGRRKIRQLPANLKNYALSPDNKKILVIAGENRKESIFLLGVDTIYSTLVSDTTDYRDYKDIAWLPDNKHFIYNNEGNVYKSDGVVRLLLASNAYTSVLLSPDGNTIIYREKGIYAIDINTRNETMLYTYAQGVGSIKFSQDGDHIAFQTGTGGYNIMNKDGSDVRSYSINTYDPTLGYTTGLSIVDWSADEKYFILSAGYTHVGSNGRPDGYASKIYITSPTETDYTKFKIDRAGKWSADNTHLLSSSTNAIDILDTYTGSSKTITTGTAPIWIKK